AFGFNNVRLGFRAGDVTRVGCATDSPSVLGETLRHVIASSFECRRRAGNNYDPWTRVGFTPSRQHLE
ncbi:MAG: hypothetical protein AAF961_13840, partial [Planctomycetota bacterium]